ncbi:MAG: class I SAM-dependent methyltransferase [Candidatus Pacebacteria bacterium]|nr:class I SAM-dependent methyltransferase [Candidatus Paceibacterota bacterium]
MQGEFLNPNSIIDLSDISDKSVVCDFGCGSNGWTIPLAKKVPYGMVYAVDVSEEYLSLLDTNLKRLGINNVKLLLSDLEKGVKISSKEIDLLVIANVLFQVDDISVVLEEGKRLLKDNGQMIVVDWKDNNPFGLKDQLVDFDRLKDCILKIGFKIEKEFDSGSYHRCLIIRKL